MEIHLEAVIKRVCDLHGLCDRASLEIHVEAGLGEFGDGLRGRESAHVQAVIVRLY